MHESVSFARTPLGPRLGPSLLQSWEEAMLVESWFAIAKSYDQPFDAGPVGDRCMIQGLRIGC